MVAIARISSQPGADFRRLIRRGEGIIVLSALSPQILESDANAENWLGYEKGSLEGLRFSEIEPDGSFSDTDRRWQEYVDFIRRVGHVASFSDFRTAQQTSVRVHFTAELVENDGVENVCLCFKPLPENTNVDISGATVTRSTARIEKELERSQRLASVGLLAAGIAHEVNNPLGYILSNLELALQHCENEEQREALIEAMEGTSRVRSIVGGLRTFAAERPTQFGAVNLVATINQALRLVHNEIAHRAKIVQDLEDPGVVWGDAGQLTQVFVNLLLNAAHAIDAGRRENNTIRIECKMRSSTARVSVIDSGKGMSQEQLSKVFDPFFTTKRIGEGTGLGLSICHNLVTQMGGTIELFSTAQVGTTATVALKRVRRPSCSPTTAPEAPSPPVQIESRLSVLLVDDEVGLAKALKRLVSKTHDVELAFNGLQALVAIFAHPYDVIVCDVMMPDMTGIDLLERVRAFAPELEDRFIFITGGTFAKDVSVALEQHTHPCLTKPFGANELIEAIRNAVDERVSKSRS